MAQFEIHQPWQSPPHPPPVTDALRAQMARDIAVFRQRCQAEATVPPAVAQERRDQAFLHAFCERNGLEYPATHFPQHVEFARYWEATHGTDAAMPDKIAEEWERFWAEK